MLWLSLLWSSTSSSFFVVFYVVVVFVSVVYVMVVFVVAVYIVVVFDVVVYAMVVNVVVVYVLILYAVVFFDKAVCSNIWEEPVRMWKGKKVEFLASLLLDFFTLYIVFALLQINMFFKHLEASHLIADTKAQLSDFKLGKRLFQFLRYEILKICNQKFNKV